MIYEVWVFEDFIWIRLLIIIEFSKQAGTPKSTILLKKIVIQSKV